MAASALVFYLGWFLYWRAEAGYQARVTAHASIGNISPLYYNGIPMGGRWARHAIAGQQYMNGWYAAIGEGIVTVAVITLPFFLAYV